MRFYNLNKLKLIKGAKLQYINKKKKPLLYLKVNWYDNITTWEESSNISQINAKSFEDNILINFGKDNKILRKKLKSSFKLIPYIVDNQQRNISHFSPIIDDSTFSSKLMKLGISIDFPDYSNRSPLDISLNYDKFELFKTFLSLSDPFNLDLLNYRKLFYLCNTKAIFAQNNQQNTNIFINQNFTKVLKIIMGWFFYLSYFSTLDFIYQSDKSNFILIKNFEKENINKWINEDSLNMFRLKRFQQGITTCISFRVISIRKKKNITSKLVMTQNSNRVW